MINNLKKYCVAFFALTLFCCSPTDNSSPLPEDFFVKFFGAQSVEKGKEILAIDGGFLLFGSTTSENLTGDVSGDRDSDFYLVLTDNEGNQSNQTPIVFDADANGDDIPDRTNQIPGRIKPTSDGGFIMIGTTTVRTGDLNNTAGQDSHTDIVVHKTTATGEHVWSATYANLSTTTPFTNEEGYDILEDTDGGFVMVGTTSGVDINKKDFTSAADDPTDIFMLKVDATGQNRLWELTFGFNGSDQGRAILKTPAGGFAVLGSTSVDKDGAGGGENILFATTDANGGKGTEQFKAFGSGPASANNDYASTMRVTSDGGFIIVGTSSVNEEDVINNDVDSDNRIILMKVTSSRTLTYFETLNIGDQEGGEFPIIPCNGNDVIELNNGGFLIAGKRIGGKLEGDNSGEDVFLVKANAFGKIADDTGAILDGLWAKKYGGLGDDSAEGLLELADGKLMVVGTNDFGGTNSTMMMLMKLNREGNLLR